MRLFSTGRLLPERDRHRRVTESAFLRDANFSQPQYFSQGRECCLHRRCSQRREISRLQSNLRPTHLDAAACLRLLQSHLSADGIDAAAKKSCSRRGRRPLLLGRSCVMLDWCPTPTLKRDLQLRSTGPALGRRCRWCWISIERSCVERGRCTPPAAAPNLKTLRAPLAPAADQDAYVRGSISTAELVNRVRCRYGVKHCLGTAAHSYRHRQHLR